MHIVFTVMTVIAIVFAIIFMTEKQWYIVFFMGLAIDLCVLIAMISLNMKIVEEGGKGNIINAAFSEWGSENPAVMAAFWIGIGIGIIIAVYGLIRVYLLKRKHGKGTE